MGRFVENWLLGFAVLVLMTGIMAMPLVFAVPIMLLAQGIHFLATPDR